jgi:hypothetical protein
MNPARTRLPWLLLLAAVAAASVVRAQEPPPSKVPEPQVLNQVTEDDHVRIEELRVRGQTKKLTVKPKIKGLDGYEIVPIDPSKAPSDDTKAGQRVWWSFTF